MGQGLVLISRWRRSTDDVSARLAGKVVYYLGGGLHERAARGRSGNEPHLPVFFISRFDAWDRPQRGGNPAAELAFQLISSDEFHHRDGDLPAAHIVASDGLDTAHVRIVGSPLPCLISVIDRDLPRVTDHWSTPFGMFAEIIAQRCLRYILWVPKTASPYAT
jgi:hypothetical protein